MSDDLTSSPEFYDEDTGEEIDDDFLYHLYQGGDLLQANRVVEAKDHLEKAFSLKPTNARSQNLLGLVYFKLGLFQRAIDIYRDLVSHYPDDPTLRVNLAMVYFKADNTEDAEAELRSAVELDPDHRNANRYLGLVLVRKGDTAMAREHFERAGVRNLERLMGAQEDGWEEVSDERREEIAADQHRAIAEVADQGFRELEDKEIPFEAASSGTTQPPKKVEPVAQAEEPDLENPVSSDSLPVPDPMEQASYSDSPAEPDLDEPPDDLPDQNQNQDQLSEPARLAQESQPAISARVTEPEEVDGGGVFDSGPPGSAIAPEETGRDEFSQVLPEEAVLFSIAGDSLTINNSHQVYCRLQTLLWSEGELNYSLVHKRYGGEDTRHSFDREERAMILVEGRGSLKFGPPATGGYYLWEHTGDSGYFAEEAVFAFFGTQDWENGRLPSNKEDDLPIFHMFADGPVILCCASQPRKRTVVQGAPLRVRVSSLVGWSGNLTPRLFVGDSPLPDDLWIDLTGDGEVLCLY